ncbi:dihydrofolate reductase [Actinocorallia populi]|uniref:dihydrofolate reductase n=1 Tax=Actinocorallia populi TaxID=2079200 RepID=UPI000D092376|nr:dihydrofolate reductase [Actinocorallia populi]
MTLILIVAAAANDVIGRDNALPWHLPEDLRHFRKLTTGNVVVMGRKTYDSIITRLGRPLPDRSTVVLTRDPSEVAPHPDTTVTTTIEEALSAARSLAAPDGREIFVCGGSSVYAQALPDITKIHLTRVHRDVDGDATMPEGWLTGFTERSRQDHSGYSFIEYAR